MKGGRGERLQRSIPALSTGQAGANRMTSVLQDTQVNCKVCHSPITRQSKSGMCKHCVLSARNSDPEFQAKRTNAVKLAFRLRPELSASRRAAIIEINKSPEKRLRQSQRNLETNAIAKARDGCTDESRKRGGKTHSARCLAHIPPEYRDEYRRLIKYKRLTANEASSAILAQHAKDMANFRKKLRT